mmetsp:Transcript_23185/g.33123  ORF Transcript_23185/g.33123 Transcript_23185/m.33123 type:complete len:101 (-) Transcript_23185:191-493(-)
MESYASLDFGARRLDINSATNDWRGARNGGRRMISGSAKRLYKNPSTSSPVSGPPRLSKRTPTLGSVRSGENDGDATDNGLNATSSSKVSTDAVSNFVIA